MKNIIWFKNRLSVMTIREIILFRIPQLLGKQVNRLFPIQFYEITPRKIKKNKYTKVTLQRFFHKSQISYSYSFFNIKLDLDTIKEWNYDYLNNIKSQDQYYLNISRQDFRKYGDVKYVSELSRLHFLPFFALKYLESEDEQYIDFIENTLKNWNKQNRFLHTINWTSGIEVGIRAVNLVYTYIILSDGVKKNKQINTLICKLISQSYAFLRKNLSLYSSANNHLIAELCGLNIISTVFSNNMIDKERDKWKLMFDKEVIKQLNRDGVNMELSTRYHAEVLDHMINVYSFRLMTGEPITKKIKDRFLLAKQFLEHVSYDGVLTEFGDSDEGFLINPYMDKDFNYYNSVRDSIINLTNQELSNNLDLRNYLIFGENKVSDKESITRDEDDVIFKDSGYAFLYDHKNRTKFSFDFGNIGDNHDAAHGHSDIFHFNLQSNGFQYFCDSGTYQYHCKDLKWREYFRSVKAHNVISIDHNDHAVSGGRMLWLNKPKSPFFEYKIYDEISELFGKVNLKKGDHSRRIIMNKKKKKITIIDKINTKLNRLIIFYLQINHRIKDYKKENNSLLIYKDENHFLKVTFSFNNFDILKGEVTPEIGWHSPSFGVKVPSYSLRWQEQCSDTIEINTEIDYSHA